ncbi:MAG: MoxR family ATPase [Deltaproteobacteria bacterium]|nr:MoxR family ATPase [Deltaproteobacteria bacterium]
MVDLSRVQALRANMERMLVGKPDVVRLATVALFARGHLLLEDVPGVGKTTLALAISRSLAGKMRRIQFTVDLLPADVLGVSVFDRDKRVFEFRPGPVFANIVLADEVNRATPKTQSALLEAMNEFQVTIDNDTHPLPQPFMVIATQNPLEFHGTYPLPESQLDRFLVALRLGYPDRDHERQILRNPDLYGGRSELEPVITPEQVIEIQNEVERVRVAPPLEDYVLDIVHAIRDHDQVELGVSTRGAVHLYRAAQAHALVEGRDHVLPDDVKQMAVAVLAHRIVLRTRSGNGFRPYAQAAAVIQSVLGRVVVPV